MGSKKRILGPKLAAQGPGALFVCVKMVRKGTCHAPTSVTVILGLVGPVRVLFLLLFMRKRPFWPGIEPEIGLRPSSGTTIG